MANKVFTIGITTAGNYDSTTTYKKLARVYDPTTNCSYLSKKANNVGHAVTDTEWWQKDTADVRPPLVEQTAATATIQPNCLNKWTGVVPALNITLAAGQSGIQNEYMLEFTVTGESFALTCSGLRWVNGETPDWEDGYTYQVSIVNGLGVAAGWEPES